MVSYAAPSFYARGATGQEPSAQVALLPVEPLPLTQLPLPPSTRLDEAGRQTEQGEPILPALDLDGHGQSEK